MDPLLYITKSSKAKSPEPTNASRKNVTGEQHGGNYIARRQLGYNKDGKPRYRYFRTAEELERYNKWKSGDKAAKKQDKERHKRGDKLSDKKSKEDKKSEEKATNSPGKLISGPKLLGTDREKEDTEVTKSLIFVRRIS